MKRKDVFSDFDLPTRSGNSTIDIVDNVSSASTSKKRHRVNSVSLARFSGFLIIGVAILFIYVFYEAGWSNLFVKNEYGYYYFDIESYLNNIVNTWNAFKNSLNLLGASSYPDFPGLGGSARSAIGNIIASVVNSVIFLLNVILTPIRLVVTFIPLFSAICGFSMASPLASWWVDSFNSGFIPYMEYYKVE